METWDRDEILARFRGIPTGNISDAMDHLQLPSGVITGLRPLDPGQKPAAGYAVTVQQAEKGKNIPGKGKCRHRMVINTMLGPGNILVIDAGGRTDTSTGGGLLALRAKICGAEGFLVNGCLRDRAEIVREGFPVYLKGTSPISSGNVLETRGVNVPVVIDGVKIFPGDLIVMDDTGCLAIPASQIESVLRTAETIVRQEARAEELLRQGVEYEEARGTGIREYPWED